MILCGWAGCRARGQHWDDCNTANCGGCLPRRAADISRLCQPDIRRLGDNIAALPDLHRELEHNLIGGSGGEKTPSKPGSRVPSPAAMDVRADIRAHLVSWARLVIDECGYTAPADTITAISAFLKLHVDWLAGHEAAGDCMDEFAAIAARARRIAYPNGTRVIEVGNCLRETDGQPCDGVIKAILRRVDSLLPSEIVCDTNKEHTWDATQWLRLGRQLRPAA